MTRHKWKQVQSDNQPDYIKKFIDNVQKYGLSYKDFFFCERCKSIGSPWSFNHDEDCDLTVIKKIHEFL